MNKKPELAQFSLPLTRMLSIFRRKAIFTYGGMLRKQKRLPRYSVRSFVALPSADIEHFCGDIFFDQRVSVFFGSNMFLIIMVYYLL